MLASIVSKKLANNYTSSKHGEHLLRFLASLQKSHCSFSPVLLSTYPWRVFNLLIVVFFRSFFFFFADSYLLLLGRWGTEQWCKFSRHEKQKAIKPKKGKRIQGLWGCRVGSQRPVSATDSNMYIVTYISVTYWLTYWNILYKTSKLFAGSTFYINFTDG